MFLFPIIFVVGLAYAGIRLGNKLKPSDFHVGAALPAPRAIVKPPQRPVSYVGLVDRRIALGMPVSEWLQTEAMREAFDRNDWANVGRLASLFNPASEEQPANDEKNEKPDAPDSSPLDGVDLEGWQAFVEAVSTRESGYQSAKHTGRFEQNLSRLRQLSISPPSSSEDEYKALVADMSEYWESEGEFIRGNAGEVVQINGQDVAVTPSGILGLLKAAGPDGARSWLSTDSDRERFPKTTEIFVQTNGCF